MDSTSKLRTTKMYIINKIRIYTIHSSYQQFLLSFSTCIYAYIIALLWLKTNLFIIEIEISQYNAIYLSAHFRHSCHLLWQKAKLNLELSSAIAVTVGCLLFYSLSITYNASILLLLHYVSLLKWIAIIAYQHAILIWCVGGWVCFCVFVSVSGKE